MGASVMAYTVGEVGKIAKVSVRALHHWDEIGLVVPSRRSPKGYRLYTDEDLDRLQQVLFFRELGLSLEDIAAALDDPRFDRREALERHRAMLEARVTRDRALLDLVDRTLRAMNGEETMSPEDKFAAFGSFDPEAHEAEASARWGETPAWAEAKKRTARYGVEDWKKIRAEADAISHELAALMGAAVPASDARAIALAERHRLHIDRWFYPCDHAMQRNLGEMYVQDPRFAAAYDRVRAGLSTYLRDAIVAAALSDASAR